MNLIKDAIDQTLLIYRSKLEKAEFALQKLPREDVRIRQSQGRIRIYIKHTLEDGKTSLEYVRHDSPLKHSYILAKYYRDCVKVLKEKIDLLEKFYSVSFYHELIDEDPLLKIWNNWPEELKCFTPLEEPRDTFREKWEKQNYYRLQPPDELMGVITKKGDLVRSKSERLIADRLLEKGIAYHYEEGLQLYDRMVFPDFSVLVPETQRIIHWEHLGMMDDPGYEKTAFEKIKLYMASGYWIGKDLIFTYESRNKPLQESIVDDVIQFICNEKGASF